MIQISLARTSSDPDPYAQRLDDLYQRCIPALGRVGGGFNVDDARIAIRDIVGSYAQISVALEALSDGDDLYDLGMTSHATVNVMLALEEEFDIEFPEELLTKETFQSVAAMRAIVCGLVTAG